MSVLDKLKKNSTISETSILSKSKLFNEKDIIPTSVPMLNVALSGDLNGGLTPGITEIAGPSRYFKSNFGILLATAYLNKYKDGAVLFYDSEFGTPKSSFTAFGADQDRIVHSPITDVEILKIDLLKQVKDLTKGKDRVLFLLDSLGQTASRKEVEDAEAGESKADMSRAKSIKSLFRLVTPHFRLKDVPMIVINHTYKEIGMYPKDIAGGGTGLYFAADTIWFMGRETEKEEKDVIGFTFNINVEKSRFVKEKSKIPVRVTFDGGIDRFSGLLDNAMEGGFIVKTSPGWYQRTEWKDDPTKKKYKEVDMDETFWTPILANKNFQDFVRQKYELSSRAIFHMDQAVDTEESEDSEV